MLIVNGHGGNIAALGAFLPDFARETGLTMRVTTYFEPAKPAIAAILEDQDGVHHACEVETSMMMVVAPDTVRSDKLPEAHGPAALDAAAGRRRALPLVPRRHGIGRDRRRPARQRREGRAGSWLPARRACRRAARSGRPGAEPMVERRRFGDLIPHLILLIGVAIVAFPVYLCFVGSTHEQTVIANGQMPITPGALFFETYYKTIFVGTSGTTREPVSQMLLNSFVMATIIAVGKIAISIISAYAVVYFHFPFRMTAFWLIFMTLMLPVEVRIYPTYKIAADLNLLDSYAGLTIPLIASATATLFFRQFFMTIPDELIEASKLDGAGPFRFFKDTVLPLSRTNIAALFVILFIYGWNQYLWPLLITTRDDMQTIVIGIKKMIVTADALTEWNVVMATAMLAMLPPVAVVILMQRWFVKGLVETEK